MCDIISILSGLPLWPEYEITRRVPYEGYGAVHFQLVSEVIFLNSSTTFVLISGNNQAKSQGELNSLIPRRYTEFFNKSSVNFVFCVQGSPIRRLQLGKSVPMSRTPYQDWETILAIIHDLTSSYIVLHVLAKFLHTIKVEQKITWIAPETTLSRLPP